MNFLSCFGRLIVCVLCRKRADLLVAKKVSLLLSRLV
uniref:Uncharacterized protein n=1 Tax=Oryza nivara TaxID=4536 RepID=A0A0E0I8Z9_ORYNI